MKSLSLELIKDFFRDRTMLSMVVSLVLIGIAYGVYLALSVEPSDLQVATRYTAFGDTHFYRSKWYYLLSFAAFGAMLVAVHTSLAIKLYGRKQRSLAIAFLGLTIAIFVISWIITQSVLRIAFL